MSLRAQRGNRELYREIYAVRDCFVVPPRNDNFYPPFNIWILKR